MNKAGLSNIMLIIIGFALMSIVYFFTSVLVYETGQDYLITPTANIGKDIIGQNTVQSVNQTITAGINTVETDYSNFVFPYDLFFAFMWVITFGLTIKLAFLVNKSGIFEFFGFVFMGTLFLLLMTAYVSDFVSWFLTEVFNKVFSDAVVPMPFFLFYLNNLGVINFVWWLILVLVNIIDRSFISKTGEVEP